MSTHFCKNCNINLENKIKNIFCSKSCAATYNNSRRPPRTNESKELTSKTLKSKVLLKTKVIFCTCIACSKKFVWSNVKKGHKKYCSMDCLKIAFSERQSERLKNDKEYRKRLGRSNMSYMESSFADWLISFNIQFEQEKQFYDQNHKKAYYADFYFSHLNLIIELDGSQHKKTIQQDTQRDKFIKNTYGIKVIRVSHKEYKNKSRLSEIKQLLGIGAG